MGELKFEQHIAEREEPRRTDIALFVGLLPARRGLTPQWLERWLRERGIEEEDGESKLLDRPVPITSWDTFDELFEWDARSVGGPAPGGGGVGGESEEETAASYTGAAIRSFFSQGGRKCYVVRVGDPLPLNATKEERDQRVSLLLPGVRRNGGGLEPVPSDRRTWKGIGHLFRLPDVSFVAFPDMPDLLRSKSTAPDGHVFLEPPPPVFGPCSEGSVSMESNTVSLRFRAPTCDEAGYVAWGAFLRRTVQFLASHAREVQLVAAVPLPSVDEKVVPEQLFQHFQPSAFAQLTYPWLQTGLTLPGGLEPPDGALVGLLANNALSRGTFQSAADLPLSGVGGLYPLLERKQLAVSPRASASRSLAERVSVFGYSPAGGIRLLSDVTTSSSESYRPAPVNRLVSVVVRAARRLGENVLFESSGEGLWAQVRHRLGGLLSAMYEGGLLRGASPSDAFEVRCDRSTMTQQDIDQGRLVVRIRFEAAYPIETITVVLAMQQGELGNLTEIGGRSVA